MNVRLNTVRAARDDDDADAPRRRRASVTTRAGDDDGARVCRLRRSRATSVFRRPSRAGRTIAARRARRPTTTDRRRPTDDRPTRRARRASLDGNDASFEFKRARFRPFRARKASRFFLECGPARAKKRDARERARKRLISASALAPTPRGETLAPPRLKRFRERARDKSKIYPSRVESRLADARIPRNRATP